MQPLNISAVDELISAISALNTYPLEIDTIDKDEYLSQTIKMVGHAIEHINSALTLLSKNNNSLIKPLIEVE